MRQVVVGPRSCHHDLLGPAGTSWVTRWELQRRSWPTESCLRAQLVPQLGHWSPPGSQFLCPPAHMVSPHMVTVPSPPSPHMASLHMVTVLLPPSPHMASPHMAMVSLPPARIWSRGHGHSSFASQPAYGHSSFASQPAYGHGSFASQPAYGHSPFRPPARMVSPPMVTWVMCKAGKAWPMVTWVTWKARKARPSLWSQGHLWSFALHGPLCARTVLSVLARSSLCSHGHLWSFASQGPLCARTVTWSFACGSALLDC